MDRVECSECGSPHPYPPNPVLCSTPFCKGRMGGSDEYVPSRIEATRNMSQPVATKKMERTLVATPILDVAPDVAERRQYEPGEAIPVKSPAHGAAMLRKVATARAIASRSPHQDVLLGMPTDHGERKERPICTGLLDYFPAACAAVANLSLVSNDQHNPGEPLHWARGKSTDQADTIVRHLMQRGTLDSDGVRHSTKVAWRALALLQEELEAEAGFTPGGE